MVTVNVALVGIGNCASSLVQGLSLYSSQDAVDDLDGIRSGEIAGYRLGDIEIVAAFDVSTTKVGKDLADAIHSSPNQTLRLGPVPRTGVKVLRGPTLDGISETCRSLIIESGEVAVDVVDVLRRSRAEVVVSYLPVGSDDASYFYASAALEAGCGLVNCMPTPVASNDEWRTKFKEAGLPVIGDDVKSQMGATVLHRTLVKLFGDRGVKVLSSYQLNIGGNSDFLNMRQPERGLAKEKSKIHAIEGLLADGFPKDALTALVEYAPALGDRKTAYIRIEGATFGSAPVSLDVKLDVWDSPNSAGVVVDAIRYAKIAMDRNYGGAVDAACAYLMKSPPKQQAEEDSQRELDEMASWQSGC